MVSVYVLQQLPPPLLDALPSCNFKHVDFSSSMFIVQQVVGYFLPFVTYILPSAQFLSNQITDNITPLGLRPPEVILGG